MARGAANTGRELELEPVDWEQLELLARLTPAERALAMMRAQAFVMAGLRGAFARRFPELWRFCRFHLRPASSHF
jgi:hypothetical protein